MPCRSAVYNRHGRTIGPPFQNTSATALHRTPNTESSQCASLDLTPKYGDRLQGYSGNWRTVPSPLDTMASVIFLHPSHVHLRPEKKKPHNNKIVRINSNVVARYESRFFLERIKSKM